jgi:hypothetical protein
MTQSLKELERMFKNQSKVLTPRSTVPFYSDRLLARKIGLSNRIGVSDSRWKDKVA